MHCRFFLILFLLVYIKPGVADTGAWNCEKVLGGDWTCVEQPTSENENVLSPIESNPEISTVLAKPVPARKVPVYIQPPTTVAKRPGWTCESAEEDNTWSCNLIGRDPKGKARVVHDPDEEPAFLTPAFDFNQEQVFDTLYSQLKYDPWENCSTRSAVGKEFVLNKDLRDLAPMDVRADYSEVFDKEITSFFGNVEIIRADQKVSADMANYDTVSETMDAQGHVYYSEDAFSLYSDTALLKLGSDEARMRNALFISPSSPIRGSADVIYRDSKVLSRYTNAAFTSCRPGNQDWVIHAERLKMNKETGQASAKHAWVEFKGIPFLYTPYISFPIDDRRLSGFLAPTFGVTDDNGYNTTLPYYWNIAPNYDLTVWPRYMSKRGAMLGGEFRYLTEMAEGSLAAEYLPYDYKTEEARYSARFKNYMQFTPSLSSDVDLNYVSDDEYFDELNNALGLTHNRFLPSHADIRYEQEGISFVTRAEIYQTIDSNINSDDKPYLKLPQVNLNLDHSFDQWPVDLAMDNEYVYFYREGRVRGHRFNTKPSIAVPLENSSGYITPKVSLQFTQYDLTDQLPGKSESISRTLPIFSVDSGLFFEKELAFADSKYQHTIEPRLFYLYIPEDNQSDIPIFDSSVYDVNFSSMFRENRFSGTDRVQDANQITVAMTTRLIDSETGDERLNFSLGEIFYFEDRNVVLPGAEIETSNFSNVVAEFNGLLTDTLSFSSGLQWDPDDGEFSQGRANISYNNQSEKIINLGYLYRRDDPNDFTDQESIIQTDASFRWPIYDNWYGVGRWVYSMKYNSTTDSFLGLEKESCCWRFSVLWRRFADSFNDEDDDDMENAVFVQLELKGLSSFGSKVDEFLEKNLKGYLRDD